MRQTVGEGGEEIGSGQRIREKQFEHNSTGVVLQPWCPNEGTRPAFLHFWH
jgi:hypothetical protein